MIDSVRIIWRSILEGIAQARRQRSSSVDLPCPTCKECGSATVRSRRDHLYQMGSTEEVRTEPLVKAQIVFNIPVFQCMNQKCGLYYMDPKADEDFGNLERALRREIKARRRA